MHDTTTLTRQVAALPSSLTAHLRERGFDPARLAAWAGTIGVDRDARNRLPGLVEPPAAGDVIDAPVPGTAEHAAFAARGEEALRRGEVALCVLAGGMATRMGGVVKALVEALPASGAEPAHTFLDLRLREVAHLGRTHGARVPLWLMTSEATHGPIRQALDSRWDSGSASGAAHRTPQALGTRLDGRALAAFEQFVSLRLTPGAELYLDDDGHPSAYATGHGDLPDALRASGLLDAFLAQGGKLVCIANLDNLGATVDPAIVGWHLAHGAPVSVELVDKVGSDRGGGPVRWNGRPIITEEFRLPVGFDPTTVPVFNTNTFVVSAQALHDLRMEWTYVEVEKKTGGHVAVQFERLLGEITAGLASRFLRVPRDGTRSRFLPVKDVAELDKRRPEIEAVARARGVL